MAKSNNDWRDLLRRLKHQTRLREELGDHTSSSGRIKRPKYMKTRNFDAKIRQLKRCEKDIRRLLPAIVGKPEDEL